ncbi:MAG: 50S ribosomal protein L3 [Patescibacteria group bacterium]
MKYILAKKMNMTQRFTEDGTVVPVTVVTAGPSPVVTVRTKEKDGYTAVQVGFGTAKKQAKSLQGQMKGAPAVKILKEFRVDGDAGVKNGDVITAGVFQVGDKVKVVGISKGKGFQGVVKRHGFKGSRATHGNKDQLRMPGSIGATAPQRVIKGMRMGGHMGHARTTVHNLEVVEIDTEKNLLFLKGAVPGPRGNMLMLSATGDAKLEQPPSEEKKTPDQATQIKKQEKK